MRQLDILRQLYRDGRKARRTRKVQKLIDEGEMKFPKEYFLGKRVMLIGPAITVEEDLAAFDVSEFDIIVRMNRWSQTAANIRTRTEVLYHNLTVEGLRAAGNLCLDQLEQQGTKYVVYPHADPKIASRRLTRTRQWLQRNQSAQLVIPDLRSYTKLRDDLEGNLPTTGAVAISSILDSQPEELCITGFTFFTTGYDARYNPAVKTRDEAQSWARSTGLHEPCIEMVAIHKRLAIAMNAGIRITLGQNVQSTLSQLD